MILKNSNSKRHLSLACAGLGLLYGSFNAHAAFFDDVDKIEIPGTVDGESIVLYNSTTSPDGRFTYVGGQNGIFIFSRDQSTGILTQVDVHNGTSYVGKPDIVDVKPDHTVISPDGNHLYMAGYFGYRGAGVEGDAPIAWQRTVVKFDRDTDSGLLTFNDNIEFTGKSTLKDISEITLSKDGTLLFVARGVKRGEGEVHLVTTANMESQFKLEDDPDAPALPSNKKLKLALSPDDNTLYISGTTFQMGKNITPALSVIDVDRGTNRLTIRQTILEEFFKGTDTSIDSSAIPALHDVTSINPSDDGNFVYTAGKLDSSEENSSATIDAIGLWSVEDDGTLSLVRSMNMQELVYDVTGGSGDPYYFSDIDLSPNGNHFVYISENNWIDVPDMLAFSRDPETGLLSYIDDNIGTTELKRTADLSITPDGRFVNITLDNFERKIIVVDTAVDREVTINTLSSTETTSNLQVIVSNNGPTDDYAVQVVIDQPADVQLSSDDERCNASTDTAKNNLTCSVQSLPVGGSMTFDILATASNGANAQDITATASSNKIDIDASNDTDTAKSSKPAPNVEQEQTPVNDDTSEAKEKDSGGGCSVGGKRSGYDLSFLMLLLASAGVFIRRRKLTGKAL